MSTKIRPAGCCQNPRSPASLPAPEADRLVAMFKALGDRTRLAVFRLISAQEGPICACDVGDRFDLSQPTISHHLKVLRDAGLVTVSRQGVWAYYAVDTAGLSLLGASFDAFSPPALALVS